MVKINNIIETNAFLVRGCVVIGEVFSVLQVNDIRIQIAEQQLEGYYFRWKGERILINKHGRLSSWPKGFFDTWDNQMDSLMNIQIKVHKDSRDEYLRI